MTQLVSVKQYCTNSQQKRHGGICLVTVRILSDFQKFPAILPWTRTFPCKIDVWDNQVLKRSFFRLILKLSLQMKYLASSDYWLVWIISMDARVLSKPHKSCTIHHAANKSNTDKGVQKTQRAKRGRVFNTVKGLNPGVISKVSWVWSSGWT